MHFKLHIIAFMGVLASFFSTSCSLKGNPPNRFEIVDMRVNHFRQTAIGEGPYLVYLVQEEETIGTDNWSYLYEGIEGFDYVLGYIYDLKVRKIEVENPPADGSSIKYILVSVRSKEKVPEDESFNIDLKNYGENFVISNGDELSLLYEYLIDCNDMCESLFASLESEDLVTGTFIHGPNESLYLQSFE